MAGSGAFGKGDPEQGVRVRKIKDRLKNLCSGDVVFKASPGLTAEVEAEVLEDILAFESVGKGISLFEGLQQNGLDLPRPGELTEGESRGKSMEVLRALAEIGVFCIGFDSMSGRKLYRTLYNRTLWEGCYIKRRHQGAITLIDISRKMPRLEMERFLAKMMAPDTVH